MEAPWLSIVLTCRAWNYRKKLQADRANNLAEWHKAFDIEFDSPDDFKMAIIQHILNVQKAADRPSEAADNTDSASAINKDSVSAIKGKYLADFPRFHCCMQDSHAFESFIKQSSLLTASHLWDSCTAMDTRVVGLEPSSLHNCLAFWEFPLDSEGSFLLI